VNWSEPEYPQTLLQIYDPPVLLYVRSDAQILNAPSLALVGTPPFVRQVPGKQFSKILL
jgi:DNA processing protein